MKKLNIMQGITKIKKDRKTYLALIIVAIAATILLILFATHSYSPSQSTNFFSPFNRQQFTDFDALNVKNQSSQSKGTLQAKIDQIGINQMPIITSSNVDGCYTASNNTSFFGPESKSKICYLRRVFLIGADDVSAPQISGLFAGHGWQISLDQSSEDIYRTDFAADGAIAEVYIGSPNYHIQNIGLNTVPIRQKYGAGNTPTDTETAFAQTTLFDESRSEADLAKSYRKAMRISFTTKYYNQVYWHK